MQLHLARVLAARSSIPFASGRNRPWRWVVAETRSRHLTREIRIALLTVALVGAGISGSWSAAAAPPPNTVSYSVQAGDTLYGIAIKLGVADTDLADWVSAALTLNSLASPELLQVGQSLTLPAPGLAGASRAPGSGAAGKSYVNSSPTSPAPPLAGTTVAYTVQAGDTLSAIASKRGVSESDLAAWTVTVLRLSGLASADFVVAGQSLTIPGAAARSSFTAAASPGSGAAAAVSRTVAYTVQAGETLTAIAATLGVSTSEQDGWLANILRLNSLATPDLLVAGQTLALPPVAGAVATNRPAVSPAVSSAITYGVQAGDTLAAIAGKLGVSDADLAAWTANVLRLNGLTTANLLVPGQPLSLPAVGGAGTAASPSSAAPGLGASMPSPAAATMTYIVQAGESLNSIAIKLGVSDGGRDAWYASVVGLNGLTSPDLLGSGQSLTVPAMNTASTSGNASATGPSFFSPSAPAGAMSTTTYTVQPGETLSLIAAKLGVPDSGQGDWLKTVARLSALSDPDVLAAGQALTVPASAAGTSDSFSAAVSGAPSFAPPPTAGVSYTIASGDTLLAIANKLGVAEPDQAGWVASVINMNGLADANRLAAGKTLTVPAAPPGTHPIPAAGGPPPASGLSAAAPTLFQGGRFYTVQPGDTLQIIAQKVGIPAEKQSFWIAEVSALNGVSPTALPVGDGLRLP